MTDREVTLFFEFKEHLKVGACSERYFECKRELEDLGYGRRVRIMLYGETAVLEVEKELEL